MLTPESPAPPIAIVGIGCRFPGSVHGAKSLWNLLQAGVDAIKTIPADRWNSERFYDLRPTWPGAMNTSWGGFIDNVESFDARFFGISPREAARMDPQQRLLLEVVWESLEDAGVVPERRRGSDTGVFIGVSSHDYWGIQTSPSALATIDAHTATGGSNSIVANRISYIYDFRGPSVAIDTACSSSLVAIHLACQSLHAKECDIAVAGGVNLILSPPFMISLSQASMLSPTGRSRAFDATADGYVRAEGVGVVVLEPLSQAIARGDRVYAVIRGTAVNQDGKTNGITLPNGEAQQAAVRSACARANIEPREVGYVEAHGTGTPVGDPIEANALGRVLSETRGSQACLLGSIKTNIGHCESAAGIAGLIKAALCVYRRQLPPSLHFTTANPAIPMTELGLEVVTAVRDWPDGYPAAFAGVNSFGFGGTNAHAVLEQPPTARATRAATHTAQADDRAEVMILSARSHESLIDMARGLGTHLRAPHDGTQQPLHDMARMLARRRSHHREARLALVAESVEQAAERLSAFASGGQSKQIHMGSGSHTPPIAFVFNGQGPQWWGMGRRLIETEKHFRAYIERCDELMRPHAEWSLMEELTRSEADTRVHDTAILQPTMFAIQVALADLWKSWGIVPDAVIGHSMGEIAAAQVAGVLTLEDACRVICHRGRIQATARDDGGMLYVALSPERAENICADHPDRAWVAAENSPSSTTLAGFVDTLEEIRAQLQQRDVFCRMVRVNCACHTQHMDPLKDELLDVLDGVTPRDADITIYSTVLGEAVPGLMFGTDYWWWNLRQAVRFRSAFEHLLRDGYHTFVEVGPHPALQQIIKENLGDVVRDSVVLPSLHRKQDDRTTMLDTLGALYSKGATISWQALYPEEGRFVELPHYAWHGERYWHESHISHQARVGRAEHPLLEQRLDTATPTWEVRWNSSRLRWIEGHDILGAVIVPAVAYIEAALAATRAVSGHPCGLEFVEVERPVVLTRDEITIGRISVSDTDRSFTIHTRDAGSNNPWARNVKGRFYRADEREPLTIDIDSVIRRCGKEIDMGEFFGVLEASGFAYGAEFRGMSRLLLGEREAIARVEIPDSLTSTSGDYLLHPAVWDGCLQIILGFLFANGVEHDRLRRAYLPTLARRVQVYAPPRGSLWSHGRLLEMDAEHMVTDLRLYDETGRLVVSIDGLEGRGVRVATSDAAPSDLQEHVYRSDWCCRPLLADTGGSALAEVELVQLVADVQAYAQTLVEPHARRAYYEQVVPALDELCSAYLQSALVEIGWNWRPGTVVNDTGISRVIPRHQPLLRHLLGFLSDRGVLEASADSWRIATDRHPVAVADAWRAAMRRFPNYQAEIWLLHQCGERLADVLLGRVDPLQIIFPDGSSTLTEQIFRDAPTCRIYNLIAQRTLKAILDSLPKGRRLTVLELGAGTGGMTSYLLPCFDPNDTDYVFTDISTALLGKAKQSFPEYGFVSYKQLDIERSPAEQGFESGSIDIVLACDVLHATRDLRESLAHVRELLAPGGMLILIEVNPPSAWLDLTYGLTEGWWRFQGDDTRPAHPLLAPRKWLELLDEQGFDTAVISDTRSADDAGQAVLVGRMPRDTDGAAVEPNAAAGPAGTWMLVGDLDGLGDSLAKRIHTDDGQCVRILMGQEYQFEEDGDQIRVQRDSVDDMARVLQALAESRSGPAAGIVYLLGSTGDGDDHAGRAPDEAAVQMSASVLTLVQAIARESLFPTHGLFAITRGAQAISDQDAPTNLAAAALWGLGRVVRTELPNLGFTTIDLVAGAEDVGTLWTCLRDHDGEVEIALRGGERYVRRLVRIPPTELEGNREPVERLPENTGFKLETVQLGTLDGMYFRATERVPPGPGEVEIAVVAGSLNFRDVMIALRMIPGQEQEDGSYGFGDECSGIVTAVGEGIERLSVGDEVIAVSGDKSCFRSFLTIDHTSVVRIPENLDIVAAAGLPIAFLTAWYALHKLGRVCSGERVLIHSATGGLGLAAVHVARWLEADVFATAGSPDKREYLRALGIQHVMDSRSLSFADEIMQATENRGVDLVLNSLAGDAISRGMACLAPYGRFVEVGKRDLYANSLLDSRPFLRNLSYFAFDLRQAVQDRPDEVRAELKHILELMADDRIAITSYRVIPISSVHSAFRHMTQARHIGKMILSFREPTLSVAPLRRRTRAESASDAWLITGGLGGFGLAVAEWLAARGVERLVLIGRGGASRFEAEQAVAALQHAGVEVVVEACDVADREQLARVISDVERRRWRLRGVIHAAMVLDDAPLQDLDASRLRSVIAPKASGAWNLHLLTKEMPIEHFVLFSSATSVLGLAGQANYAAANSFLDALAYHRRASGLPALAINWGALSGTGYVARHPEISRLLSSRGVGSFSAREALALLDRLMSGNRPQVGVMRIDWETWLQRSPTPHASQLTYEHVLDARSLSGEEQPDTSGGRAGSLASRLAQVSGDARIELLEHSLREQIAHTLGLSVADIDTQTPLTDLGMDSLLAAEVSQWCFQHANADISVMQLMRGPTIEQLARQMNQLLSTGQESPVDNAPAIERDPGFTLEHEPVAPSSPGHWLHCTRERPDARVRLICLPYLGGGAAVFHRWAAAAPEWLEIHAVELPGHGERVHELAFTDMDSLVSALIDVLAPLMDLPVAIYGHSIGALMGFELAHALRRYADIEPLHLFVGAAGAPDQRTFEPLDDIEAEVLESLAPEQILDRLRRAHVADIMHIDASDDAMVARLLPAIKAEILLAKRYQFTPGVTLEAPVTVFYGTQDQRTSADSLAAWSRHTNGAFSQHSIAGSHLFIRHEWRDVVGHIERVLRDRLDGHDRDPAGATRSPAGSGTPDVADHES